MLSFFYSRDPLNTVFTSEWEVDASIGFQHDNYFWAILGRWKQATNTILTYQRLLSYIAAANLHLKQLKSNIHLESTLWPPDK